METTRDGLPVPEHDRYEWVGRDEAIARCLPKIVGDGVRLADDTLPGDG